MISAMDWIQKFIIILLFESNGTAFLSIPTISLVTDLGSLFSPDSGIYVNALISWKRMGESCFIRIIES